MSRAGVVVLALVLTACASAAPRSAGTPAASEPAYSTGVAWVTRSAEYQAAVLQAYRQALAAIEVSARGRTTGSWAVILDADETVISNLVYQQELERTRRTHSSALWKAWVQRREAVPLPGAKAFLDRVRTLGGRIAIVTNRLESECADTRAVFDQHALAHDVVLCRPDAGPSDKNPRFEAVAAGAWLWRERPACRCGLGRRQHSGLSVADAGCTPAGRGRIHGLRRPLLRPAQSDVRQLAVTTGSPGTDGSRGEGYGRPSRPTSPQENAPSTGGRGAAEG